MAKWLSSAANKVGQWYDQSDWTKGRNAQNGAMYNFLGILDYINRNDIPTLYQHLDNPDFIQAVLSNDAIKEALATKIGILGKDIENLSTVDIQRIARQTYEQQSQQTVFNGPGTPSNQIRYDKFSPSWSTNDVRWDDLKNFNTDVPVIAQMAGIRDRAPIGESVPTNAIASQNTATPSPGSTSMTSAMNNAGVPNPQSLQFEYNRPMIDTRGKNPKDATANVGPTAGQMALGGVKVGLDGLIGLGQVGLGIAGLVNAREAFNFNKGLANRNLMNQAEAFNMHRADVLRGRHSVEKVKDYGAYEAYQKDQATVVDGSPIGSSNKKKKNK